VTSNPNAFYAQQTPLKRGVPEADIVEFALSRTTVDDTSTARPVVENHGCSNLIVVSSDFHMPRVEFIFRADFPEHNLTFQGAPYLASRSPEECAKLLAHEDRELTSLRERGESIVGGALKIDSWRQTRNPGIKV